MRIDNHPILGPPPEARTVDINVDGKVMRAVLGEPIAAALLAAGKTAIRTSEKRHEPRGVFCAIGRCTDCLVVANGQANVRACVTPVEPGMSIQTMSDPS